MTAPRDTPAEREADDFGAFGPPAGPSPVEVMPGPCPSCKGTQGRVITHNGEHYWQCMSPRGGVEGAPPCKFWSTKMRV